MAQNKKLEAKALVSKADEAEYSALTSTAARVRWLTAKGHSRGDIARFLDIKYQWVRNVQITPLKKQG